MNELNKRQADSETLAARATQVQQGAARAAVLGVNDGLVSTVSIVVAVAAASSDQSTVLLAGFAGLVAGAVSMAAGEWISVQSQVDLFNGILDDLKAMLRRDKKLLKEKLTEHLIGDGYSRVTAAKATDELSANHKHFYITYAEQVIGIDPKELGSPWMAAIASFGLFVLGALAPLLPWFFIGGNTAILLSIILTSIGGLLAGAYVARSSGKSILNGSLRQLGIVLLAASVTYIVGYLFGVSVS